MSCSRDMIHLQFTNVNTYVLTLVYKKIHRRLVRGSLTHAAQGEPAGSSLSSQPCTTLFQTPDPTFAGALNPPAQGAPAAGGYRLTGRMPFISGRLNADWILGPMEVLRRARRRCARKGCSLGFIPPSTSTSYCPVSSDSTAMDPSSQEGMSPEPRVKRNALPPGSTN